MALSVGAFPCNPHFLLDADLHDEEHGDDMEGAVDEDDLSSGLVMAVSYHIRLLQMPRRVRGCQRRRRRHRGSVRGRALNKKRDFNLGLRNILRDYWSVDEKSHVFDKADFESPSRMPRAVFMRVHNDIKDKPFFRKRVNATRRTPRASASEGRRRAARSWQRRGGGPPR